MEALVTAGANFLRNNFAHAQYDEYRERKAMLDEINVRLGTHVCMQADLQGRNIRVQKFENEKSGIELEAGQSYTFYTQAGEPVADGIRIEDATLHQDVKAGEAFILADGAIDGIIESVDVHKIVVKMLTSGFLKSRKSINVPETQLTGSSITDKDRRDLEFLLEAGIDWVALSFISTAAEIEEVRALIGDKPVKIMAKVERREAIKNITEIIEAADAVMIARGDLGIEVPMEEVPILQRMITEACRHAGKPVITATQMLLSMAKASRPTRAEVTDVAHAVFDRSDAVMLSEETAEGVNPPHALATMVRIAGRVEEYLGRQNGFFPEA
jgi:pyruvate kinase